MSPVSLARSHPALVVLAAAILLASLPGLPAAASAAPDPGDRQLIVWESVIDPADPDWIPLHRLATGMVGLLPAASPQLDDPAVRILETYDERAAYIFIPRSSLTALQAGRLPERWRDAFTETERSALRPTDLQGYTFLAADGARALVRLSEPLLPVADHPGCRSQLLPDSEKTRAHATT
ncbi:MAG: hypothetical protein GF355_05430, partial [Candidatus Eisenbacteria bacterium]|nr:hypothetical protein [Candidatus Eisenbacteria bacterium]